MHLIHVNLLAYLGSLAVSLGGIPIAIRAAKALNLVDEPGARKVHRIPVPHIGGLVIALATVASFAAVAVFAHVIPESVKFGGAEVVTLLVAACTLMVLGFVDDIYDVPSEIQIPRAPRRLERRLGLRRGHSLDRR